MLLSPFSFNLKQIIEVNSQFWSWKIVILHAIAYFWPTNISGRSAARLARFVRDEEVGSSNLPAPTCFILLHHFSPSETDFIQTKCTLEIKFLSQSHDKINLTIWKNRKFIFKLLNHFGAWKPGKEIYLSSGSPSFFLRRD